LNENKQLLKDIKDKIISACKLEKLEQLQSAQRDLWVLFRKIELDFADVNEEEEELDMFASLSSSRRILDNAIATKNFKLKTSHKATELFK